MDLSNIAFDMPGSLMKKGEYPAKIERVEKRTTKAGTGEYYSIMFRITGEKYANKCLFQNYNIKNPNSIAVEKGLQQLTALAVNAGVSKEQLKNFSAEMLADKTVNIYVDHRNNAYKGEEEEYIKYTNKYKKPENIFSKTEEVFGVKSDKAFGGDEIPF